MTEEGLDVKENIDEYEEWITFTPRPQFQSSPKILFESIPVPWQIIIAHHLSLSVSFSRPPFSSPLAFLPLKVLIKLPSSHERQRYPPAERAATENGANLTLDEDKEARTNPTKDGGNYPRRPKRRRRMSSVTEMAEDRLDWPKFATPTAPFFSPRPQCFFSNLEESTTWTDENSILFKRSHSKRY